ncbi:MAG: alpha-galactosidase [Clostridium sp.]|nr:alpha-galactosidase [Clostridium sp.]
MISVKDQAFFLETKNTSYIFKINDEGHLINLHYGRKIRVENLKPLEMKLNAGAGSTVLYGSTNYSMDLLPLEYSFNGKGDYRIMPLEIIMEDGSYVADFIYDSYMITDEMIPIKTLPQSLGIGAKSLVITLKDKLFNVNIQLIYTVYEDEDVITRRVVLLNKGEKAITLHRIMSMNLDLLGEDYKVLSLHGGWIKETHKNIRDLTPGIVTIESTTGASSNRHNPGVILLQQDTTEDLGDCYGFNLIYSGNHQTRVELSSHGQIRIQSGINPHAFHWTLENGESFEAPEAVLSFSHEGLNGLSHHMHKFVNQQIIPLYWQNRERPVLYNNWEATMFDFNQRKILSLAKKAKYLGTELFVLDDGWFGRRVNDLGGLGDYDVNLKRIPGGLKSLGEKINAMGMDFGLWFEPEMISINSALYESHPEYVMQVPGRDPAKGRQQLVLDLCQVEVQDYIISNMTKVLKSAPISYVKWDMNRHMSDVYSKAVRDQGRVFHTYIMGLYRVFNEITKAFPKILFESCSSGGNRFDLGMLCYTPQIWASDNTDPIERLKIQEGLSYFYPMSSIGAHVSESPHQQTLRNTPLETRFHVATFGLLGYEMDLHNLNQKEEVEIKNQIKWYKSHRKVMQFGQFYRFKHSAAGGVQFQVVNQDKTLGVFGNFQVLANASPGFDVIRLKGIDDQGLYQVKTVKATMDIGRFGSLLKHVSKVRLKPQGFVIQNARKYYRLAHNEEYYRAYGDLFKAGFRINQQFMGTGYQKETRILGDFGSQLMTINKEEGEE